MTTDQEKAARLADLFDGYASDRASVADARLTEPARDAFDVRVAAALMSEAETWRQAADMVRDAFGIHNPRPTVNVEAP